VPAHLGAPSSDVGDGEARGVAIFADGDPPVVTADVVGAKGMALPISGSRKSCTLAQVGVPLGCHPLPTLEYSSISSLFFASTLMTGCHRPNKPPRCR
jgi:hypothetical protein